MPVNQQFDCSELRKLDLPYDTMSPELSPDVRLVAGSNMYVTNFGKLSKRPGTTQLGSFAANALPGKVDHFIIYETIETVPKIWLVASVANSGHYEAWALRLDGSGTPASLGSLRGLNASTAPHEFATSRGLCYIKSFPAAGGDLLGSVIFNGSTNTVTWWGLLPPTVASHVRANSTWDTASFSVTVNFGWYYVYTWKTVTGQESSRSPLEQNPSKASSNTGAFSGTVHACPHVYVQGNSDTTNIPLIVIYRSTDGGGSFYKIDEITNTGSGNIEYADRNYPDGNATPSQPYPDTALDTTQVAPSLTQNSPPPTVAFSSITFTTLAGSINSSVTSFSFNTTFNGAPLASTAPTTVPFTAQVDNEFITVTALNTSTGAATVVRGVNGSQALLHGNAASVKITPIVGFDTPVRSTPIAAYSGRLWYGIGNILFYSGQEEIGQGVPEECWPSGLFGNFYRLNYPIVNVYSTSEALYVFCTEEIYWLRGNTKDTFQLIKLFSDLGAKRGHPRAICAADKSVLWLTQDLRIAMARGYKRDFLSDKIAKDVRNAVLSSGGTLHLCRHAELEKDWLILLSVTSTLANCRQLVYDFNAGQDGLWNIPWTQPVTAVASGQPFDTSDLSRHLVWAASGGSTSNQYVSTDITGAIVSDFVPGSGATPYGSASFTLGLIRNPTGNHVNQLRLPGMVSVLQAVKMDRTSFNGDHDPTVTWSLDDLTFSNQPPGGSGSTGVQPPRRVASIGYDTIEYMVDAVCERVGVVVTQNSSDLAANLGFEVQNVALIWNPDSGA